MLCRVPSWGTLEVSGSASWPLLSVGLLVPSLDLFIPRTLRPSLPGNFVPPYPTKNAHSTKSSGICTVAFQASAQVLPGMWLWLTRLLIHCNHIFIINPCEAGLAALAQVNSCLLLIVFANCHLPRSGAGGPALTGVLKNCVCIIPIFPFWCLAAGNLFLIKSYSWWLHTLTDTKNGFSFSVFWIAHCPFPFCGSFPSIPLARLPQSPCGKGEGELQRRFWIKEHTAGHQLFTRQSFGRHKGLSMFVLLKPPEGRSWRLCPVHSHWPLRR